MLQRCYKESVIKGAHMTPVYKYELTVIPAWVSKYIHCKVWDEITYQFPKFNIATIEVWELRSNLSQTLLGMW